MEAKTIAKAREELAEIVNMVAYGHERCIIKRRNKELVAVVSMKDLQALEAMEDALDVELAKQSMKEKGSVSWEKVKAKLDAKK